MKRCYIHLILSLTLLSVLCTVTVYAHPGRTRPDGGHYDNETGEYHYHCNGNPPHLHNEDGSCPYNETEKAASEPKPASYSNVTPKPELHIQTPNPLTPTLAPAKETNLHISTSNSDFKNKIDKIPPFAIVPTIICILIVIITSILHKKNIKKLEKEHIEKIKTLKQKHAQEIENINSNHEKELRNLWETLKEDYVTSQPPMIKPKPSPPPVPKPKCPDGYGIDKDCLPYKLNRVYYWGKEFNVFVTQNGHCYHRSYCKALKGKGKVKTVLHRYDAIKKGYDACPHCEPNAKIDSWYIKMFPNSPYSELSEKNQNNAHKKIQQ